MEEEFRGDEFRGPNREEFDGFIGGNSGETYGGAMQGVYGTILIEGECSGDRGCRGEGVREQF